jgi:tRNA dimethylallyltransferase
MKPKVLVIVGPTASGKTALGIELAKQLKGEIISADSRQVYRGLDLGTGKVTEEEMAGIPHHLLDIKEPSESYTASEFSEDGRRVISEIVERKHLPIIVGGTFFYIDALLGKFTLPNTPPNPLLRAELEKRTPPELYTLLKEKDPRYADIVDKENPRRLIRAIEIIEALGHIPSTTSKPLYETLTLGIQLEKEVLKERIEKRLRTRLQAGMIEEVQNLLKEGVSYERLQDLGIEYRYISRYLHSTISYDEMVEEIKTKSWQYAKRQMTWLKRDETIVWVDPNDTENIEIKVRKLLEL